LFHLVHLFVVGCVGCRPRLVASGKQQHCRPRT
jgi:hypothetical protein